MPLLHHNQQREQHEKLEGSRQADDQNTFVMKAQIFAFVPRETQSRESTGETDDIQKPRPIPSTLI